MVQRGNQIMDQNNHLEGEKLCIECGLCCQGVFHPCAMLFTEQDIKIAKNANTSIEFNKEWNCYVFTLPCPVFNGKCSIYPDRPSVCSEHECDLLKKVIQGTITLEDAQEKVIQIKNILSTLLPELKEITKNNKNFYPRDLVKSIFDSFKNDEEKINFKKENKKLLMEYGAFCILEEKYFYKKLKNSL